MGFFGESRTKAAEVIRLNSKYVSSSREKAEKQAELKSKVNQLFDMRVSDPLILNRLKRVSLLRLNLSDRMTPFSIT